MVSDACVCARALPMPMPPYHPPAVWATRHDNRLRRPRERGGLASSLSAAVRGCILIMPSSPLPPSVLLQLPFSSFLRESAAPSSFLPAWQWRRRQGRNGRRKREKGPVLEEML